LWGFSYLVFFHTAQFYGFSKPSPLTKMFHLFMTLRVVGVAFELHDTWTTVNALKSNKRNSHSPHGMSDLELKYKGIMTTPYDIVSYVFCYIGMLTGPYYTYRTYNDMLNGWPPKAPGLSFGPLWRRLQEAPFFGVAYLISSQFVSFDDLRDPEFQNGSLVNILVYLSVLFFVYRTRLYFAWIMGECVCMSVGLGAYPAISRPAVGEGPTDLVALNRWVSQFNHKEKSEFQYGSEQHYFPADDIVSNVNSDDPVVIESHSHFYNYATVQAVSVWKCEFSPTVRESFGAWNQTLYYWMDRYMYRRCFGPRFIRSVATLVVNSLWYGVQPIYFIAHLTLPIISLAEDGMATTMAFCGFSLPPGGLAFLRWFFRMRYFEYLAAGWIIISLEDTLVLWSSLGYFVQVIGFLLSLAHLTLGRFVSAFERWTVENPGEDVAEITARNLSQTGKAWEPPVTDTYL
uniref:Lysophospholipid acyltransferase 7 n=1 Tax=Hydatigena taeniaeformis TaxID=6205 RepID=A0A0R3WMR5_HYDTA